MFQFILCIVRAFAFHNQNDFWLRWHKLLLAFFRQRCRVDSLAFDVVIVEIKFLNEKYMWPKIDLIDAIIPSHKLFVQYIPINKKF